MVKHMLPIQVVPLAVFGYGGLAQMLLRSAKPEAIRGRLKLISAVHASLAAIVTIWALTRSPFRTIGSAINPKQPRYASDGNLDDSKNPLIQHRSDLANAITAWETGYLLWDSWAMIRYATPGSPRRSVSQTVTTVAQRQPAIFAHHTLLSLALLYLQYYIYSGRERGVWIVVAMMVMNASNPLMHGRWWLRQRQKASLFLDLSFAVTFWITRIGLMGWILRRYGAYHGLSAAQVLSKMRLPCQFGTGTLTVFNALWWTVLVNGIVKRNLKGRWSGPGPASM